MKTSMLDYFQEEITSFSRYEKNQLSYIDQDYKDFKVTDSMSFGGWINKYKTFPNIIVSGLEDKSYHLEILKKFNLNYKINSVILFYNQLGGFSFPEHKDDVSVFLYVVKGAKKIYLDKQPFLIKEEQGITIPKDCSHRVDSLPETWALSIGYDE